MKFSERGFLDPAPVADAQAHDRNLYEYALDRLTNYQDGSPGTHVRDERHEPLSLGARCPTDSLGRQGHAGQTPQRDARVQLDRERRAEAPVPKDRWTVRPVSSAGV